MSAYWDWVRSETGKPPLGVKHPQLQKLVRPFIEAGYAVPDVKRAMAAIRSQCRAAADRPTPALSRLSCGHRADHQLYGPDSERTLVSIASARDTVAHKLETETDSRWVDRQPPSGGQAHDRRQVRPGREMRYGPNTAAVAQAVARAATLTPGELAALDRRWLPAGGPNDRHWSDRLQAWRVAWQACSAAAQASGRADAWQVAIDAAGSAVTEAMRAGGMTVDPSTESVRRPVESAVAALVVADLIVEQQPAPAMPPISDILRSDWDERVAAATRVDYTPDRHDLLLGPWQAVVADAVSLDWWVELDDPISRYWAATGRQERAERDLHALAGWRDRAVVDAQADGMTVREIANLIGLSPARVQAMIERGRARTS